MKTANELTSWTPQYPSTSVEQAVKVDVHQQDGILEVMNKGIWINAVIEDIENGAVFITDDDTLYLRRRWNDFLRLDTTPSDDVLASLRKLSHITLYLASMVRAELIVPLYQIKSIPDLWFTDLPSDDFNRDECFTDSESLRRITLQPFFKFGLQVCPSSGGFSLWLCENHLFLVYIFDDEKDWVASEDSLNGAPPIWYKNAEFKTSPVYEIREKARNILSLTGYTPHCILLVSESSVIKNIEDVLPQWAEPLVLVCTPYQLLASRYCPALEDVVTTCLEDTSSVIYPDSDDIQALSVCLR